MNREKFLKKLDTLTKEIDELKDLVSTHKTNNNIITIDNNNNNNNDNNNESYWIHDYIEIDGVRITPIQICSECFVFFPLEQTGGAYHYCPSCGAKKNLKKGA